MAESAFINDRLKVVKFGGSSLADAEQFRKVANIVLSDPTRRYVIPSAPGKRFKDDNKVTDMLYSCYDLATNGEDYSSVFEIIMDRYNSIIKELSLDIDLTEEFNLIDNNLKTSPEKDYIASRGEYLNGLLLSDFLGFDFIDASDVIFFKEGSLYNVEMTNEVMSTVLKSHRYAVIPGFYGRSSDGNIKTFSRGGSDITGSIVSRAVNADMYENWTDVSGFLMADPRIVDNPKIIDVLTYSELRELSYMGATVLHEESVFPVRVAGIPINIKNTNHPEDKGILIVPKSSPNNTCGITGIAGKKGFSVINIEKDLMNASIGFGKKVLDVLEKYNVSFEHLPSGIDTMGIVVNTKSLDKHRDDILYDIKNAVHPDLLYIEDGLSLVAVVGRGMVKNIGVAARIITAISRAKINIRMMDQGTRENNIIFSIDEDDFEKTIKVIYNEFAD